MTVVFKGKKFPVLVVDDFSTMRRIIRGALREMGIEDVCEAEDGKAALQKLKLRDFKLIISDWNMPNLMGIDLLRRVRADPSHRHIPFLMVTAEARRDYVIEAAKAGVSNYITKPFTPEDLQKKIESIILRQQQSRSAGTNPNALAQPSAAPTSQSGSAEPGPNLTPPPGESTKPQDSADK